MNARRLLVVAILCGVTPLGRAAAQDSAAIESCIRANAARVEQAFESLSEATTFLVASVCAKPVSDLAAASRLAQEERRSAQLDAICAQLDGASPLSPLGSRYALDCETRGFADVEESIVSIYQNYAFAGQAPPEMIGLAASLLLDARLARRAAEE
jgi:hypothetical protein